MTDWVNIPNSNIEAGKPGRAVDVRALRDNPKAIAEGAAGAPRIEVGALSQPTAGNVMQFRTPYVSLGANINCLGWYCIQRGVIRWEVSKNASSGRIVRVRMNEYDASIVYTFPNGSGSFTVDLPIAPFWNYFYVTGTQTAVPALSSSELRTNGESIYLLPTSHPGVSQFPIMQMGTAFT